MNRYATSIIHEFTSEENREYLMGALKGHFNSDPTVSRFLALHFDDFVSNYAGTIRAEMSMSDPLPGTSIFDQVTCFNNQFIDDRIGFIKVHVGDESAPVYMVKDDLPTSRHGIDHYRKSADRILESWKGNSGRGVQAREDPNSDVYPHNTYYGQGDNHMATGVVFCDQSEIGMQRHQDMFFGSSYHQALNRTDRPHELTPFGVSTPAADARLLSRSIFRKNEAGVENGIMRRDARLHNRYIERDVTEALGGGERGCIISGHDMTSLRKRIDHKREVHSKYDPRVRESGSQLRLQNNNGKVPEDMRYC